MNTVIEKSSNNSFKLGLALAALLVMALVPLSVSALGGRAADDARETTESATRNVGEATQNVGDTISETASELGITNEIRQEIMEDTSLTSKAKGVSVSTDEGTVTLKGEVASVAERDKVLDIARKVATGFNINNQMEVNP